MIFVGFYSFHDFLSGARPGPVYLLASATEEYAPGVNIGISTTHLIAQAFDRTNDQVIRYWQMRIGKIRMSGGTPVNTLDLDQIHRVAIAAETFLADEIRNAGRGFEPIRAQICMPQDTQILADMTALEYDSASSTFRWKNPPPPAAPIEPSVSITAETTDEPGGRPDPPAPPGVLPFPNTSSGRQIGYTQYQDKGGQLTYTTWRITLNSYLRMVNQWLTSVDIDDHDKLAARMNELRDSLLLDSPA